jgi:hypothetical protein
MTRSRIYPHDLKEELQASQQRGTTASSTTTNTLGLTPHRTILAP